MSNDSSQIHGYTEQAIGKVQESMGSAMNNQSLEIQGKARKFAGGAEVTAAKKNNGELQEEQSTDFPTTTTTEKVEDRANEPSVMHGITEKVIGIAKDNIGGLTGNLKLELEGKARRHAGTAELTAALKTNDDINNKDAAIADQKGVKRPLNQNEGFDNSGDGGLLDEQSSEAKRVKFAETSSSTGGGVVVDRANDPSMVHGYKEQLIGAVKDSAGALLNDTNTQIEGKARKISGAAEVTAAKNINNKTLETAER